MSCENPDHDVRFKGVMFAKNGCLACAFEELQRKYDRLVDAVRLCESDGGCRASKVLGEEDRR